MEGERGTVCVTGGTGYLASWLIMKLLEQGYSVNTTVRPHPGNRNLYRLLMESNMVHVEDVAMAHIFLLEYPGAKGRYICSSDRISLNGMSEFLSARYPDLQIPTKESLKDITGYKQCGLSSEKLLDCGFRFEHGLEDMFDGAIQSCKEKGFI